MPLVGDRRDRIFYPLLIEIVTWRGRD